ncbi:MAG: Rne/Rng family ribonuclease [Deltaproteobacteria bacterium]|nr:Rne/Rng family ribonuclease [Deltaproteobacteria bacterium]MBW1953817.1 Rne/Rng family ribonuclease [Deltaproteobacteria bacterium]MBW1987030.1 Rne/Rng family ribonuclease [Deltaproteobacteria bacterium]MBW2134013.1 Rne/Rng family ribonuclease [Deltaproteobacteria bacterium]
MLINASDPEEIRVAIVENRRLEDFTLEAASRAQTKGNIYKGVISNIEASLQAAFVQYGVERQGFLPISEVHPEYFQKEVGEGTRPRIQDLLSRGQELLVQVAKEETGTKGAYLTTYISLPGRYLVLLPGQHQIGVSRKIEGEELRQRLKEIIQEFSLPPEIGLIVRTASANAKKRDLTKDFNYLMHTWEEIKKSAQVCEAPCLVYKELDLFIRTIRDYYTSEIKEILIDDPEIYRQIKDFFKIIAPKQSRVLKLYKGNRPLFENYHIEPQIEQIYHSQVPLPSGGSIVISPTEALVAIDVNSGRCLKPQNLEETAFKTNVEAAGEIARQLRLRDLAGLIVIDFIDMKDRKHRKEVEKVLKQALKLDKARVTVGQISKFGLLELSRQRLRPTVQFSTYGPCPFCEGLGLVKSPEASGLSFLRKISHEITQKDIQEVRAVLPSQVAYYLLNKKRPELLRLEKQFNLHLVLEGKEGLPWGEVQVEYIKRSLEPERAEVPAGGVEPLIDRKGAQNAQ